MIMVGEEGGRREARGRHVGGWCRAALYTRVNNAAFDLTRDRNGKDANACRR